jgi:hypothetical protein
VEAVNGAGYHATGFTQGQPRGHLDRAH